MAVAAATRKMTTEELLAMPEDGVDRWPIRGELREKPTTKRNRSHSAAMARLTAFLSNWRDQQPAPRGTVLCGEAGCILSRAPDTTVGVDVVYISAELAAQQSAKTILIEGAPLLAAEILSPNDTLEEMHEKIQVYLETDVSVVWVLDPYDQTVRVYQPGKEPQLFNAAQELSGEPHLPGFRVAVRQLFA